MTSSIIDEFSRECLAIRVKRRLNSTDVIDALTGLSIVRGVSTDIHSDHGPEFIVEANRQWIKAVGAETLYIEPGSSCESGYCESFNARFRDELLNGGVFCSQIDDQIVTTAYETKRPHSAIGYRQPAPESVTPMDEKRLMHEISNRTKPWGYFNISIHSMNYDNFRTDIHNIEILNKNNYL